MRVQHMVHTKNAARAPATDCSLGDHILLKQAKLVESTCSSGANSDLGECMWFLWRFVQVNAEPADRCVRSTAVQVWNASTDLWPREKLTFFGNPCKWSKWAQSMSMGLPERIAGLLLCCSEAEGRVRARVWMGGLWGSIANMWLLLKTLQSSHDLNFLSLTCQFLFRDRKSERSLFFAAFCCATRNLAGNRLTYLISENRTFVDPGNTIPTLKIL